MLSRAGDITANVMAAIKQHPFNQEMIKGTLDPAIFAYYLEQDAIFLPNFARTLALIAARVPTHHVQTFLRLSDHALVSEPTIVHDFFKERAGYSETGKVAPTTLTFSNHLLFLAALAPIEVAIAAATAGFTSYRETAQYIAQHTTPSNPYNRWITTYSSDGFDYTVGQLVQLFADLGDKADATIQAQMLDAYYKSTVFEHNLWDDAYHRRVFDDLKVSMPNL